jgi:hypothetical protein
MLGIPSKCRDVHANHAQFTDHTLVDWSFDGPVAGVGGKARMRANVPGEQWMEMEVLESVPPVRTVEETVGARGKRRTRGTYTLDEMPDGATDVHFQLEVLEAPLSERLRAPLIRAYTRVTFDVDDREPPSSSATPQSSCKLRGPSTWPA